MAIDDHIRIPQDSHELNIQSNSEAPRAAASNETESPRAAGPDALSLKRKLLLALLALIGVTLVFFSTRDYGAGLTPDSVGYISTARNIIAGNGVTSYSGAHLVVQPPLYPALLALVGGIFGTDPFQIVAVVNSILFGLIIYFGGLLTFRALSAFPVLALIVIVAVLTSIPLFSVSVMAWSEPLFILLALVGILMANSYIEKQDIASLLFLSIAVALSSLTRYVGIALILWGVLIVIFFHRGSVKNRIFHAALFGLIPVLAIGIWLLRNYAITGEPFGPRAASTFSLSQNLMFMFDRVTTWYIPGIIGDHRATLLLFGVAVGFLAGLSPEDSRKRMRGLLRQNSPLVLFIIVYLTFLIISSTTTAYDSIGNRLLSPIYVPLTLFMFILIEAITEPYRRRFSKRIVNFILVPGLAIWLLFPLNATLMRANYVTHFGQGFSSKAWRESETIQYIRQHKTTDSTCTMFTNAAAAVYILTNVEAAMSPAETSYNSLEAPKDISRLQGVWPAEKKACLVWFDKVTQENLFTIDELRRVARITRMARFTDGTIYSVERK